MIQQRVVHVEDVKAFLAQDAGSSSKEPRTLTHDRTDAAIVYAAKFVDNNSRQEAREERNNPQVTVPGSSIRLIPSKKKSTEGSFVTKNKGKK